MRALSRLVLLLAVCMAGPVSAQTDYPNRPVRIIVPVAAGGNVDIVARTLASELQKRLGQPFIVENRPSAASLVGTQAVQKAAADGYTLLAHSSTFFTAPIIARNAGYDPVTDFAPVTLTCKAPMVLQTYPGLPARSLAELVALARSRPGDITSASSGNGSTGHIASEVFANQAGLRFTNVFYKGNAQSILDVISGQTMLMFDQISTAATHLRSGKTRALAVTSAQRSPLFPEVPTIAESGYPGYEDVTLNLLLAPAGTPAAVVNRLHAAVAEAYRDPELVKRFAERAIELVASESPEALGSLIRAEVQRLTRVAQAAGIRAE